MIEWISTWSRGGDTIIWGNTDWVMNYGVHLGYMSILPPELLGAPKLGCFLVLYVSMR